MNRVKKLYENSGLILFLIRLPFRFIKTILNRANTFYYSNFCRRFGAGSVVEFGVKIENPKNLIIGNNVYIGKGTKIISENKEGVLLIEDNVHIGNNCHIDHTGNVTIGSDTLFSENVKLYSHTHGTNPRSEPQPIDKCIGNNSWLGVNSIILENCKIIGSYSIVAAGAVLSKNIIKNNRIYAGVPAVEIKKYDC